ncbi:hypothetical protein HDU76_005557, partial [Blyttiomyces sp. JEL0837]
WNVSGLTEDTYAGPYSYDDIIDFSTFVYFNNYFTNLTVGGFTANMSLGGSTDTTAWYPYFGDGVLGFILMLGLTGDNDRFAIFLPKIGGGNVGELSIGGTNPARYKGSIQWVDAVRDDYSEVWNFNVTTIKVSFGTTTFTMTAPSVDRLYAYVDMAYDGIWLETNAYFTILKGLNAVYDSTIKLLTVSCNLRHSAAPITLTFDSKTTLVIAADTYIEPFINDTTKCVPQLYDLGNSPGYIWLGLTFLKQYYTIFDAANSKMGFATSVQKYVTATATA